MTKKAENNKSTFYYKINGFLFVGLKNNHYLCISERSNIINNYSPTASRISGILMTTNEALILLKQAEKNMSGEDVNFTITDDIEIDDTAHLFLFENDYCKAAAVGYESGELFVMRDWQEPSRPETAEEIADYDWCTIDWQDAIIFDGLPRTL